MNALILAAGLGTRLGQFTADRPKALVEVNGHTMLEHQLRHLSDAGFDRFVINVHHFAGKVREYLAENSNFGLDITLSDESALLLDTGGGIRQAMHLFDDDAPVLVHNVDIFSSTDLLTFPLSAMTSLRRVAQCAALTRLSLPPIASSISDAHL